MSLKAKYRGNTLEYYISGTGERIPIAPLTFYDDFLGSGILTTESGSTGIWDTTQTNLNAAMAVIADEPNGAFGGVMDSDSNAEIAALDWGDQRGFNLKGKGAIEFAVRVSVAPTDVGEMVFGVAGNHNAVADTITESAWFKLDGSLAIVAETDDTTNNNDDKSTGVTAVITAYNIFRIDFKDLADVRFYIDGARVASATTFDMSNLTDAEAVMQPYFNATKATGTGVGSWRIDYCKLWSERVY